MLYSFSIVMASENFSSKAKKYIRQAYDQQFITYVKATNLFFSLADVEHVKQQLNLEWEKRASCTWSKSHHDLLLRLWLYYHALLQNKGWDDATGFAIRNTLRQMSHWIELSEEELKRSGSLS